MRAHLERGVRVMRFPLPYCRAEEAAGDASCRYPGELYALVRRWPSVLQSRPSVCASVLEEFVQRPVTAACCGANNCSSFARDPDADPRKGYRACGEVWGDWGCCELHRICGNASRVQIVPTLQ